MWKQIKIGLAGILQSSGYFLVLFLVLSMFDSKDIIKIYSVESIYMLKHGLRALLLILTQSFLVYLFSMWFEVLLHYAFITYLYKKECNKYNLKYKMFKLSSLWDSNVSYRYYY